MPQIPRISTFMTTFHLQICTFLIDLKGWDTLYKNPRCWSPMASEDVRLLKTCPPSGPCFVLCEKCDLLHLVEQLPNILISRQILFIHNISRTMGTLELNTLNSDRLFWISNVNTFNYLLNLLFLEIPTNESSLIKWRVKFHISRLLIGCSGFCTRDSTGLILYTFLYTN